MITRYVFLKFKAEFSDPEAISDAAEMARATEPGVPGVKGLVVGTAADEKAQAIWDLSLAIEFDDLDAIEAYRTNADHREFVDDYIKPKMDAMMVWNFVTER